jgi:HEAT repeat protein
VSIHDTFSLLLQLPAPRREACVAAALAEEHEAVQTAAVNFALDRRGDYRPDLVVDYFHGLLPAARSAAAARLDELLPIARQRILGGHGKHRLPAYRLVGALGDLAAVELLVLGIGDAMPEVREVAFSGLERLLRGYATSGANPPATRTPAQHAAWSALTTVLLQFPAHGRTGFFDITCEFGAQALPLVAAARLSARDTATARGFAKALATGANQGAFELLWAMLHDQDPTTQAMAQQLVRERRDEPFCRWLAEQLATLDAERLRTVSGPSREPTWLPAVLQVANQLPPRTARTLLTHVQGLGLDPNAAQSAIEPFAAHADVAVQVAAVQALQTTGCPRGLGPIERLLQQGSGPARIAAATLVVALAPPQAMALLTPLLGCDDPTLRRLVVGEVSRASFERYLQRFDGMDPRARQVAARALQKLDAQMFDRLDQEIGSLDPDRRLKALQIVAFLDAEQDLRAPLLDLLDDPDRRVRATAVRVVELAGSIEGIKVLLGALSDPDRRVRANAIEAFEQLEDPRFVQLLTPFLRDRDNRVRANAAKGLWNLGWAGAREAMLEMLDDDDDAMRLSAVWAIGEVRFDGAREQLAARAAVECNLKVLDKLRDVLAHWDAPVEAPR